MNNASQDKDREGNTPLIAATNLGNFECVRELIKAAADLNIPDKNGMTALMIASGAMGPEQFLELMKAGAEVDTTYLAVIAKKLLIAKNRAGSYSTIF